MKSLEDFNYLLSLDRRYTKTESEIFRSNRFKVSTSLVRKISAWLGYNSPTRGQASLIKDLRAASGES